MRNKQLNNWAEWVSSKDKYLLLVLLEIICLFLFVDLNYESNDDIAINILLSGSYTGTPTAFVFHINILLSTFIKLLFDINCQINWYNIVLILYGTIVFVFLNFLNYSKQKVNLQNLYLINGITFLLFISLLSSMNFSKFAALGIVSGLLPLLLVKLNSYQKVFSVLLVVIGSLIRFDLIFLMLIFLVPAFVFYFKRVLQNINYIPIIIGLLCSFGANIIHKRTYSANKDWAEYQKHFETRRKATSYDNNRFNLRDGQRYLDEVKWTENDFHLISNFMWDKGVSQMEYEKLEFMNSKLNVFAFQSPYSMFLKFKILLEYIIVFIANSGFLWILILLIMFLYYNNSTKLSFFMVFSMLYVLCILFAFSVFSFNNIFKDRIVWSAFLPVILSVPFLSITNSQTKFKRNRGINYLAFILCFIGFVSKSSLDRIKFKEVEVNTISEELERVFDKPYINWVSLDMVTMFSNTPNYSKAINMGWLSGSPHNLSKIHELCECDDAKGIYDIKNAEVNWVFSKQE